MSVKHLAAGDELPELVPDTLRLISMRFCPFAQRTRLVLAHKNIPFETVNVNLRRKPTWFLERNPLGMVPVLEINKKVIYESAICNEYLDEAYPETPLLPRDPYEKAHTKVLMEHYSKVVPKYYAIRKVSGDELQAILKEMHAIYELFEKELGDKKFYGGDSPNMLDYHMWPWLERIPYLDKIFPADQFPKLSAWSKAMPQTPAVKATAETLPTHVEWIRYYMTGGEGYEIESIPA